MNQQNRTAIVTGSAQMMVGDKSRLRSNPLNEPLPSDLILQGCEQDLSVRNDRRANEAVQFRKFFVHIGVAAFE